MQRYHVAANCSWPMPDGEYVLRREAQAEIVRLQADVDRLTMLANGKWQSVERAEDAAIWNDAIEAACSAAELYPDLDYGESYRDAFIHGCMAARDAIRALRKDNA